ncbi:hypothetical protein CCHL11_03688 [Colletotrichum chlorophyti]|uniref:Uncharacterized protein n=1 Tax=Colletotrichum chlorophyti TaxID=708187 RepID=A0A1Q8RSD2_9PEZI|nr:hypothetical protein CCHL11_03688 [Colletotrichum chlorophyti]
MQIKAFTMAVAAFSLAPVEAAILPRATITPGLIVLPEIVFNPSELTDPITAALNLVSNDIQRTASLVLDLTRTVGSTVRDRTDQANAISRQATTNANNIRTRVGTIVGSLLGAAPPSAGILAPGSLPIGSLPGSGTPAGGTPAGGAPAGGVSAIPSPTVARPVIPTDQVIQAAQNVVRQSQVLARAATAQLEALRNETTKATDAVSAAAYTLALTQSDLALRSTLGIIATAAGTALTTAANSVASLAGSTGDNVSTVVQRIRDAQVKLNPVLVIGIVPDVSF